MAGELAAVDMPGRVDSLGAGFFPEGTDAVEAGVVAGEEAAPPSDGRLGPGCS
jgi:hypothetical protein